MKLFGSEHYAQTAHRRGRWWVPLISLFEGMRLEECCQLFVNDVAVKDGTDVIINRWDDEGRKRLKSNAAERVLPIHPELKRLGFTEYVAEMRAKGETRLFPDLGRAADGYYSSLFSKWFGRYLRKIGAKTPRTSFHSFRHTYRDALREAEISVERARALGGWEAGRGADEGYGLGQRPSALAREIAKLRYDGLSLEHLCPVGS